MLANESEKDSSTQDELEELSGDHPVGPKSNVSLLDQHSKLKLEALGKFNFVFSLFSLYLTKTLPLN